MHARHINQVNNLQHSCPTQSQSVSAAEKIELAGGCVCTAHSGCFALRTVVPDVLVIWRAVNLIDVALTSHASTLVVSWRLMLPYLFENGDVFMLVVTNLALLSDVPSLPNGM
jgi:hypothetical protein